MTIVHEQNIAGAKVAGQALVNSLRIATAGVVGAACPARQLQAEAVQYGIEEGIAQAGSGAEVARRLAGNVAQGGLGGHDVGRHGAGAGEGKGV